MKESTIVAFLLACLLVTGCGSSDIPAEPDGGTPAEPQTGYPQTGKLSSEVPDTDTALTEDPAMGTADVAPETVEAPPATEPPMFSAEQTAAGRQMASDLGIVVREDAEGNVILIDAANRSWPTDYHMQTILVFPQLRSLALEGPDITDQLAPNVAQLDQLTSLTCKNTMIGDVGIAQLSGLTALKVIDMRVCPLLTDAALETLAGMPSLRAVRLSGANIGDTGIASLLKLPQLTELDIRNCRNVTNQGIEQLAGKETLRTLKIGGPQIDDGVLGVVAVMANLTGLSMDNCDITDAGVAKLAQLPLVDLTIYQCANISDKGLGVLTSFTDLTRLTLRDVAATGAALAKLPQPEKLISLNMAQSGITDAEIVYLAGLTALESLNLSETVLTDNAVEGLSKLASLKELVLLQTGVSDDGKQRLAEALPDCDIQLN